MFYIRANLLNYVLVCGIVSSPPHLNLLGNLHMHENDAVFC